MSAAPAALAAGVLAGDRRSLSRAITLIESQRADDGPRALELLEALVPAHHRGLRVGVAGPPGVGKSSLLEKLGLWLVHAGRRPALLLIDPSSQRGGGSVLGDKTRMPGLARELAAYVRPSPSGGVAGGIAGATGDVLFVCEAAGFGPCLVETVGVGQGEIAIGSVVDVVCLLLEPGAGDGLQGIKRGLLEWADVVAVNKADGDRIELARRTRLEYEAAFGVLRGGAPPPVLAVSASDGTGVEQLWAAVESCQQALERSGELERRRRAGRQAELERRLQSALWRRFLGEAERAGKLAQIRARVASGDLLPGAAVSELLGPESKIRDS